MRVEVSHGRFVGRLIIKAPENLHNFFIFLGTFRVAHLKINISLANTKLRNALI
jgi:hypothetical protein